MIKRTRSPWTHFPTAVRAAAVLVLAALLAGCGFQLNPYSLQSRELELPFNDSPISFTEITFDPRLERVVVPGAESGALVLVDPITSGYQLITGFSTRDSSSADGIGAISAASGLDHLFTLDRSEKAIKVVDLSQGKVVSSTPVEGVPDIIRFVSTTRELWVTEKSLQQIEIFSLSESSPPVPTREAVISIPFGPENLVIEQGRGLAYTNQPQSGTTAVIQVITRGVIETWGNGCTKARGMALDEENGFLFVACEEGKLVMIDIHSGFQLASQNYGGGLNMVAYNEQLQHVYLPSADSAILAVFSIEKGPQGTAAPTLPGTQTGDQRETQASQTPESSFRLVRLGTADTALGANCAAADNNNHIWVCDPTSGNLIVIEDTFEAGNREVEE